MTSKPATERRGSGKIRNRGVQPQVPSLYIHIPFCKRKCNYCDFVSYPDKEDLIDEYVDAVCKELTALTPCPPLPKGEGELRTLYFGGGTPTLLAPKHFEAILKNVEATFRSPFRNGGLKTAATCEITIEANPGTADKQKLKELRRLGINRLSMGVQSFNDAHLKTLGRIHDAATALKFYEDARSAGFDNINLDLIFALPGQTFSDWQSDLNQALQLKPNHLSTYSLIIEEGTPFWQIIQEPATKRRGSQDMNFEETAKFIRGFPSEDEELTMYEYTIDTLSKHGFEHYEISNFCRPGQACRHNITYWRNENYLGAGAAAHSHVNGQRWANPASIEEYLSLEPETKSLGSKKDRNRDFQSQVPSNSETLFMGLRLLDGLAEDNFTGFEREAAELIQDGLLTSQGGNIKLTRQGLYLANNVFERFV